MGFEEEGFPGDLCAQEYPWGCHLPPLPSGPDPDHPYQRPFAQAMGNLTGGNHRRAGGAALSINPPGEGAPAWGGEAVSPRRHRVKRR